MQGVWRQSFDLGALLGSASTSESQLLQRVGACFGFALLRQNVLILFLLTKMNPFHPNPSYPAGANIYGLEFSPNCAVLPPFQPSYQPPYIELLPSLSQHSWPYVQSASHWPFLSHAVQHSLFNGRNLHLSAPADPSSCLFSQTYPQYPFVAQPEISRGLFQGGYPDIRAPLITQNPLHRPEIHYPEIQPCPGTSGMATGMPRGIVSGHGVIAEAQAFRGNGHRIHFWHPWETGSKKKDECTSQKHKPRTKTTRKPSTGTGHMAEKSRFCVELKSSDIEGGLRIPKTSFTAAKVPVQEDQPPEKGKIDLSLIPVSQNPRNA